MKENNDNHKQDHSDLFVDQDGSLVFAMGDQYAEIVGCGTDLDGCEGWSAVIK